MRSVTKDEFYAFLGNRDVHPLIQPGPYPYISIWKLRYGGEVVGKIVGRCGQGRSWNEHYVSER